MEFQLETDGIFEELNERGIKEGWLREPIRTQGLVLMEGNQYH